MSSSIYENLQQLGGQTALPDSPETAVLERVENPQTGEMEVIDQARRDEMIETTRAALENC